MLELRPATPDDAPEILALIRDLAAYEREPDAVVTTEADLLRDGFSDRPRFHVIMAEWDGAVAGMAFYFQNYSTWQGRHGLYLEDLYVRPRYRRRGIGRALMVELARIARKQGCTRLVLQVLDWNIPSIAFYESLGAEMTRDWLTMRLTAEGIERLAE